MKKQERLISILHQMSSQEQKALSSCLIRSWVSSYDVAHWQSIPQSQAWMLLDTLVGQGTITRSDNDADKRKAVEYVLTPLGRKKLHVFAISVTHANQVLIRYKVNRLRKGLSA